MVSFSDTKFFWNHCECHFQHLIRIHSIITHTAPVAASSFGFAEVVEGRGNLTEITTTKLLKRHLSSVTQWAIEKDILPCPFQEFWVPHPYLKHWAVSTWCGWNWTSRLRQEKNKMLLFVSLWKLFIYQKTTESRSSTITGRNQSWRT